MTGFGEHLKKLRSNAHITQSYLADKLGVHLQTVSRWERDVSEPDFSMLGLIAETLGVSLEKLLDQPEQTESVLEKFDAVSFGKGIASFRKLSCESQDELACAVGVSSDTVSKWERGLICPNIPTFLCLAEHYHVPLSKLYFAKIDSTGYIIPPGSDVPEKRKKPVKKIIVAVAIICLVLLVAASVILAVCLKPSSADGTDPGIEKPAEDDPSDDSGDDNNTHEHLYEQFVSAPTCTLQGYTTYVCTICNYSYKSDYVGFLPHVSGNWIVDRQPTCTVQGVKRKKCMTCGTTVQTQSIPAVGHNVSDEWIVDSEPTCISQGEKHKICKTCGTTTEMQSIPTVGHNYVSTVVEPDGDKQGYTLHTCTGCGDNYQDNFFSYPLNGITYEYNYSDRTCILKSVDKDCGQKIEIPSVVNGFKVTAIERNAFEDCVSLSEIVIPDSVTSIGMYAFMGCVMLREVVVPDSVVELNDEQKFGKSRSAGKAYAPEIQRLFRLCKLAKREYPRQRDEHWGLGVGVLPQLDENNFQRNESAVASNHERNELEFFNRQLHHNLHRREVG